MAILSFINLKTIVLSILAIIYTIPVNATIHTYPAPGEVELNRSFTIEVRQGSEWYHVDAYKVKVDEAVNGVHKVRASSMAYFDFDGAVELRIISNNHHIVSAKLRPLSQNIAHSISGDTINFTLNRPQNLSIEINDDIFDNLQLFTNTIDTNAPSPKMIKQLTQSGKYIYFGPGYHKLDKDLMVQSGQTVYIAGGAVVDGHVWADSVHDIKILGRGMVYPQKEGIKVTRSHNVEVNGLFTTQCPIGECDNVLISDLKVMSWYGWGDGFNVFASSNVKYNNVFARTSDDCTTIYATRKGYHGGCHDIIMENSILWADVAHPIFIGLHSETDSLETIESAWYRNIDILDMNEKQLDYQGALAICCGDNNTVRNIHFENIRIENFRLGRLFDIRICYNKKYCSAPGLSISNIYFENIIYKGDNSEPSLIIGYDDDRTISNIHFKNLIINGVKISDDMPGKPKWYKTGDFARIFIGEHVENITFE
jgi:hypothetical protein